MLLVVVPVTFLLAAAVQALTGFGSALVIVPILAIVTDPVTAVVAATAASVVLAGTVAVRQRRLVEPTMTRRLLLAAPWGMPVGLALLTLLTPVAISRVIGCVLLVLVLVMFLRPDRPPVRLGTRTWGVLSGVLITSTGMNGPPLVLALRDLPPAQFRATLQAVFVVQDVLALALLGAFGHVRVDALGIAGIGVACMWLGWRLGDRYFVRLRSEGLRVVVTVGLCATALAMIFLV